MDAFEQIVAKSFEVLGYWTRIGFKVELIVYSPMASGLLTGAMTRERIAKLPDDDWRKPIQDHVHTVGHPVFNESGELTEWLYRAIGKNNARGYLPRRCSKLLFRYLLRTRDGDGGGRLRTVAYPGPNESWMVVGGVLVFLTGILYFLIPSRFAPFGQGHLDLLPRRSARNAKYRGKSKLPMAERSPSPFPSPWGFFRERGLGPFARSLWRLRFGQFLTIVLQTDRADSGG